MISVKINNKLYPASVAGKMMDKEWDNRESKSITLENDFSTVNALFQDGVVWCIVSEEFVPGIVNEGNPVLDENGEQTYETKQTEFDNSEFSIRGDLTVHVDGTCTVKMGKETDIENLLEVMYGGVE